MKRHSQFSVVDTAELLLPKCCSIRNCSTAAILIRLLHSAVHSHLNRVLLFAFTTGTDIARCQLLNCCHHQSRVCTPPPVRPLSHECNYHYTSRRIGLTRCHPANTISCSLGLSPISRFFLFSFSFPLSLSFSLSFVA